MSVTADLTESLPIAMPRPHPCRRRDDRLPIASRWLLAVLALVMATAACKAPPDSHVVPPPDLSAVMRNRDVALISGDVLEVSYFKAYFDESPYLLDVRDELRVTVAHRPDLAHDTAILPDGTCTLPLIGTVHARGKTASELKQHLVKLYSEHFTTPEVDVLILRARERLEDFFAILLTTSGGPVREAVVTEGMLQLPLIPRLDVDGWPLSKLQETVQLAYQSVMPELRTTVRLKHREAREVIVLGEVRAPGAYTVKDSMSVMRALAVAGGVTVSAWLESALLVRMEDDGSLSVTVHDLRQTYEGKDASGWVTHLRPDDLLYIPSTPISDANEFVRQYFRDLFPLPIGVGLGYRLDDNN